MENKLKHLEFIQNIVDRMARCSFLLKGWSVTLVTGLVALSSATENKIAMILISFIPITIFWILDSYYLWQERLFRAIYDDVRKKKEDKIDFSMNVGPFIKGKNTWLATFISKTIWIFYLSLIATMIIIILFLRSYTTTNLLK